MCSGPNDNVPSSAKTNGEVDGSRDRPQMNPALPKLCAFYCWEAPKAERAGNFAERGRRVQDRSNEIPCRTFFRVTTTTVDTSVLSRWCQGGVSKQTQLLGGDVHGG